MVPDVERLGDKRRLFELRLLHASERSVRGHSAVVCGSGNELRIDLLSGERGLDQRLALLDHPSTRFRRRRKAYRLRNRAGPDQETGSRIASPGDQPEQHQKKYRLKRC